MIGITANAVDDEQNVVPNSTEFEAPIPVAILHFRRRNWVRFRFVKPTEAEPSPTLHHARRRHQVQVLRGEFCPHFRMAGEPYQSIDRFPV